MPSSKDFKDKLLLTKSGGDSFETNWENIVKIEHVKYGEIYMPWNSIAASSVPFDMAFDIKKEDGWKMLLHTLTDTADLGLYAIFYNQRTGIMKKRLLLYLFRRPVFMVKSLSLWREYI